MTLPDLIPLLPLLMLSISIVVVMLVIAFRRHHRLSFTLTFIGLALTLVTLPFAARALPVPVTPLLIVDGFAVFYIALILITSLVVAIPAAMAYNYLTARLNRFTGELEGISSELIGALAREGRI